MLAGIGAACLALRPSGVLAPDAPPHVALELPAAFGAWRAIPLDEVILWPDDTLSPAIYRQIVARRYLREDGLAITAVIALGSAQNYLMQLHRPESCYPASGFSIESNEPAPVALPGLDLPARSMRAKRGDREDEILYWTRIGDAFPQDLWGQRLAMARNAVFRSPQNGVVARFSITNPAGGQAAAQLESFIVALFGALGSSGRTVLFGDSVSSG
ncbi:EpsI family protein [Altererythrobacter atlanticus]|uniref:Uncharacterized protein n=1 Tax=Croceibacterium atlanticum TaxID=1267766 RepID=A0A0F7KT83_9SPHN|nr:exosortase C-terminal domain/associated protein EpsI [Croceibacterium atlanticum]AKH42809.1 hypothetical protein WYH_01773 [Croceibacterium atlanticum]MBB5731589.1 EpsI family protein [Croceibacterium atlanticum]